MLLAQGEQDVGTLCARLGQSPPAVSHQLALLRHGRVIAPRREGARNFYALTDTGFALAGVAQNLLDEVATERLSVRPRPPRTDSPPGQPPRPAREKSIDSSEATAVRSGRRAATEEESWTRMNRRRAELIFRKNRGRLNNEERAELESLQAISRSRMQLTFPGPTLIDEKLEKIEEHLRRDGAEEA